EMGLFGLTIGEEYGGIGESLLTYALVVEELSRGWMSISGIVNTHFIVAYLITRHGTAEQRERLLPRMATGELRGAFSMSEPGCGSDVAAIRTRAVPSDAGYVINGQKMWLTNGARSGVVATRACGISIPAFELAVAYAQQRETFGKPLYEHQAIAFKLAEMGTKIEAAHALMVNAARLKDSGQRGDVEAGMAKLLASEYCA